MIDRVLSDTSGSLEDHSYQLANYFTDGVVFNADPGEYIYLGSRFPFNTKYFKLNSDNVSASTMSIEYWDGNQFRPVAEIIDETDVAGVPFGQSGRVQFVPDHEFRWGREDTEDIPELSSVDIYGMYWLRVSFSASVSMDVQWIGRKFITTNHLKPEHRELLRSSFLNAVEAGKTDWEDEIVRASDIIVDDLVRKRIINSENQLLDSRELELACVSKTAEIIYSVLGEDFLDNEERARIKYNNRISGNLFTVDLIQDGREQIVEGTARSGRLSR